MTKYALRTCYCCGIRKPQPEMLRKEIYIETGKSVSGISGSTWFGLLLGNSKSLHSINRWIFNTNQRTYKRKKQVWLCSVCAGNRKNFLGLSKEILYVIVSITLICIILIQMAK